MFIKIGQRILNAAQIVEVEIHPAREEKAVSSYEEAAEYDFPEDNFIHAAPIRVEITTTAIVESAIQESYGSEHSVGTSKAHTIHLFGEEAELFLAALPVYEPALEPGTADREVQR